MVASRSWTCGAHPSPRRGWTAEGDAPHTSENQKSKSTIKSKESKASDKSVRPTRSFVFVGFIERSHVGARKQSAQGAFTAGSALLAGDIAGAIDHNINGINIGLIHGGEIGVLREDNATRARMLLEIFLDCLLGFGNVNRQHNQSFVGEFFVDGLDQRLFDVTVLAPGGPKLQQDYLAFHRLVVEALPRHSFCAEARSGLVVVIAAEGASGGQQSRKKQRAAQAGLHGGNDSTGPKS